MPWQVEIPGVGIYEYPDEMTQEEIQQDVDTAVLPYADLDNPDPEQVKLAPHLFPDRDRGSVFGTGIPGGAERVGRVPEAIGAGVGRSQEELDSLKAQMAEEARRNRYIATWDDVVNQWDRGDWSGAANTFLTDVVPHTFGQSLPDMAIIGAGSWAGAKAGAAAGTALAGPAGTAIGAGIGAIGGAAIAGLPTFFGMNVERQIQERGITDPDEIESMKAAGTAMVQGSLEGLIYPVLGFLPGIKPAMQSLGGKVVSDIVKEGAFKLSKPQFAKEVARAATVGGATEAITEVGQQMLERAQAGLEVTNPDALKEYIEAAVLGGFLGASLGGPAGVWQGYQTNKELGEIEEKIAYENEKLELAHKMAWESTFVRDEDQEETLLLPPPEKMSELTPIVDGIDLETTEKVNNIVNTPESIWTQAREQERIDDAVQRVLDNEKASTMGERNKLRKVAIAKESVEAARYTSDDILERAPTIAQQLVTGETADTQAQLDMAWEDKFRTSEKAWTAEELEAEFKAGRLVGDQNVVGAELEALRTGRTPLAEEVEAATPEAVRQAAKQKGIKTKGKNFDALVKYVTKSKDLESANPFRRLFMLDVLKAMEPVQTDAFSEEGIDLIDVEDAKFEHGELREIIREVINQEEPKFVMTQLLANPKFTHFGAQKIRDIRSEMQRMGIVGKDGKTVNFQNIDKNIVNDASDVKARKAPKPAAPAKKNIGPQEYTVRQTPGGQFAVIGRPIIKGDTTQKAQPERVVSLHDTQEEASVSARRYDRIGAGKTDIDLRANAATAEEIEAYRDRQQRLRQAKAGGPMAERIMNAFKDNRVINHLKSKGIHANVVDTLGGMPGAEIEGSYDRKTGELAVAVDSAIRTAEAAATEGMTQEQRDEAVIQQIARIISHELVHALKELGVLTDQDYALLVRYASKTARPVELQKATDKQEGRTYLEEARILYMSRGPRGEPSIVEQAAASDGISQRDFAKYAQEYIEEEAAAEAFRDWANDRKLVTGKPASIFRKIVNFMKAIGGLLRANGVRQVEDVFRMIEAGTYDVPTQEGASESSLGDPKLSVASQMVDRAQIAIQSPDFALSEQERLVSAIGILYDDNFPTSTRSTVKAVGEQLMSWAKLPYAKRTPENTAAVARIMAAEALHAIMQDGNAATWYREKVEGAHRIAALMFPELAENHIAMTAFNFILAVTSNGETVSVNSKNAIDLYKEFRKHLPGNIHGDTAPYQMKVKGFGAEAKAMELAFDTWNKGVARYGIDQWLAFLKTPWKVGDLKKAGWDVSGELVDTIMPGSVIFGSKIGGGFFSNLEGRFNNLTMDLWYMRLWGRLTGTLVPDQDPKTAKEQRDNFRAALATVSPQELKALGVDLSPIIGNTKALHRVPEKRLLEVADYLRRLDSRLGHPREELLQTIAEEYQTGLYVIGDEKINQTRSKLQKNGIDLAQASRLVPLLMSGKTLSDAQGAILAQPTGGSHRAQMREATQEALNLLSKHGINLELADLQALVWYPEKDLWKKLGVGNKRSAPTDYETEFAKIAKKEGVNNARIERAIQAGPDGRGSRGDGTTNLRRDDRRGGQTTGKPEEVLAAGPVTGKDTKFSLINALPTGTVKYSILNPNGRTLAQVQRDEEYAAYKERQAEYEAAVAAVEKEAIDSGRGNRYAVEVRRPFKKTLTRYVIARTAKEARQKMLASPYVQRNAMEIGEVRLDDPSVKLPPDPRKGAPKLSVRGWAKELSQYQYREATRIVPKIDETFDRGIAWFGKQPLTVVLLSGHHDESSGNGFGMKHIVAKSDRFGGRRPMVQKLNEMLAAMAKNGGKDVELARYHPRGQQYSSRDYRITWTDPATSKDYVLGLERWEQDGLKYTAIVTFFPKTEISAYEDLDEYRSAKAGTKYSVLQWDTGTVDDDPENWNSDLGYYMEPDNYAYDATETEFLADYAEEIENEIGPYPRRDNQTLDLFETPDEALMRMQDEWMTKATQWIKDNYDEEFTEALKEKAEEHAEQNYMDNPYMTYTAEYGDDEYISIYGNDDIGWQIKEGPFKWSPTIVDGVYDIDEAMDAAVEWLLEQGHLSLNEDGEVVEGMDITAVLPGREDDSTTAYGRTQVGIAPGVNSELFQERLAEASPHFKMPHDPTIPRPMFIGTARVPHHIDGAPLDDTSHAWGVAKEEQDVLMDQYEGKKGVFFSETPHFANKWTEGKSDTPKRADEISTYNRDTETFTLDGKTYEAKPDSLVWMARPRVIPVYALAKKIFDFRNPTDLEVARDIARSSNTGPNLRDMSIGDWSEIERTNFILALKDRGYDGAAVLERPRSPMSESNPINYTVFDNGDLFSIFATDFSRENKKLSVTQMNRTERDIMDRLSSRDKTLWTQAAKLWKQYLMPGGLLPSEAFAAQITRDTRRNLINEEVEFALAQLDRAVRQAYNKRYNQLTDRQVSDIDKLLRGQDAPGVPEPIRTAVFAMRQLIDNLSGEYVMILQDQISDLALSGDEAAGAKAAFLRDVFMDNMGEYLNRSYQLFDDPKWASKVSEDVKLDALRYLARQYGDIRVAEQKLWDILHDGAAHRSLESFIVGGTLGSRDLSVLKAKKQIAPEIRALMGEYTDPRINFARTIDKQSGLIGNTHFLNTIKATGMGSFLWEQGDHPPDATETIAGENSSVLAPLKGLRVTPEVYKAFKDAVEPPNGPEWWNQVIGWNGRIKYGKTILSPTTQARNFISAGFTTVASGGFNHRHMKDAAQVMRDYILTRDGGAREYYKRMVELGVSHDTPNANLIQEMLRDSASLFEDRVDTFADTKTGEAKRRIKKTADFMQKLYRAGDDFWKIIGFESELKFLMDNKGMTREQAEPEAARRVRAMYPTYSLTGKGIKALSRFPLMGTFVNFPAEIIRTEVNIVRQILSDLKDPDMKNVAIRRMVGFAISHAWAKAIMATSMAMMGVDDDEEEAARRLGSPWSRNSHLAFMGRNKDGTLRTVDLSFMDPYNILHRPFVAIMRNQPWQDGMVQAILEFMSPFLGPDIAAGAVFEIVANQRMRTGGQIYNPDAPVLDQSMDVTAHFLNQVAPGFVHPVVKVSKAINGQRDKSGRIYDLYDEMMALAGIKITTIDPKVSLNYRAYEFSSQLSNATRYLADVATDLNAVSDSKVRSAFETANEVRQRAYDDMRVFVNAAKKAGVSSASIRNILRSSGVSKRYANALARDADAPKWRIGKTFMKGDIKRARLLIDRETAQELRRRQRAIRSEARSAQ